MSDELFRKIISDLESLNYSGVISLFSNNEPFLDERIFDFHEYANQKLPKAIFNLYTNGTLLTFEKFQAILPYLDYLTIDNYNDKHEINSQDLRKIYDYINQHSELKARVNFSFRLENEVFFSRAGQAPNKKGRSDRYAKKLICYYPFYQIVIRPTGQVSQCCNDALGQITMGDVNNQSLLEIWNSENFRNLRKEMLANARKNLPLCKDCDSFSTPADYARQR